MLTQQLKFNRRYDIMNLEKFLDYDEYQVIFPESQDKQIRSFAKKLKKYVGSSCSITFKATYDPSKRSLKDKDILYISLTNSKKGILGLLLCLDEFQELIEIKIVKHIHKFDLPKEIRQLNKEFFEYIDEIRSNFKKKVQIKEIKLNNFNSKLLNKIKKLKNR